MNEMIDLGIDNIVFVEERINKDEVFCILGQVAKGTNAVISEEDFKKDLIEREQEFSTGIGGKVAIPHCKSKTVKKASIFILKFSHGVEWDSFDGEPVKLAICLAIPKSGAETMHLKILSSIAKNLMNKKWASKLLSLDSKEELLNTISQAIK